MRRASKHKKSALRGALCIFRIFLCIIPFYFSIPILADTVSENTPRSFQDGFLPGGAWEKDISGEFSAPKNSTLVSSPVLNASGSSKPGKAKLPKKYDPRDESFITSIKDQGMTGLCWAFAGCSQIESSLIKLSSAPPDTDISEMQFAYFGYRANPEDLSFTQYCLSGSGPDNMQSLLMQGTGPILERDETTPLEIGDDFSLPDDYVILSDYAFYCYYTVDFSDIAAAKEVIKTCGGVCGYYHSEDYHYIDSVNKQQDTSFYHGGCKKDPNHAVDIIGWDDDFPKENFTDLPPGDGAWLIKNSWGESGYYSPEGSGYYWISYYEPSLLLVDGFAAVFRPRDIARDHVYEISGKSATLKDVFDKKSVTVPNTITIGDKKISVEYISDTLFYKDLSLEQITLGNNIKVILPQTFRGCKNLSEITFGKNLVYIGDSAFRNCTSLASVTLPDKTCIVENRAFQGCKNLKKIAFGKSTYSIGNYAFSGCRKLKTVRFKQNLIPHIGKKAFKNTPKSIKIKTKKRLKKAYKKAIKKAK